MCWKTSNIAPFKLSISFSTLVHKVHLSLGKHRNNTSPSQHITRHYWLTITQFCLPIRISKIGMNRMMPILFFLWIYKIKHYRELLTIAKSKPNVCVICYENRYFLYVHLSSGVWSTQPHYLNQTTDTYSVIVVIEWCSGTELDHIFPLLHQTQLRAGAVIVFYPVRETACGQSHFRKEKNSTADFKAA